MSRPRAPNEVTRADTGALSQSPMRPSGRSATSTTTGHTRAYARDRMVAAFDFSVAVRKLMDARANHRNT